MGHGSPLPPLGPRLTLVPLLPTFMRNATLALVLTKLETWFMCWHPIRKVWEIPGRFGVAPGKSLKHWENRHFIYIRLGSGWIKTNLEYHYNLLKCCCQRQPDRSTPQSQDKQDIDTT